MKNTPYPTIAEGHSRLLFNYQQLDVSWEPELQTLWALNAFPDKPNCNEVYLREFDHLLHFIKQQFDVPGSPLKYKVQGSHFPGIYNLGGDLALFADCVERRDYDTLLQYGYLCVDIIQRMWNCCNMDYINIAMVQGDAMGGGFEGLLCYDVVIAERQAKFALPEIKFGLFPGMGAMSLLSRKLGPVAAQKMLMEGKIYTADELYSLGIVTQVCEPGEGEKAVRTYIAHNRHLHTCHTAIYKAGRRAGPLPIDELRDIVASWAATAMTVSAANIRMMRRLAAAQLRLIKPRI